MILDNKELLGVVDLITMYRPSPIREFDQIYMKSYDMFSQAMKVADFLENQKVIFLGDGDAMSWLFLLLMEKECIPFAQELAVLDFDERIVNNYRKQFSMSKRKEQIKLRANLYNVINPVIDENKGVYDFFYINPPYGSQNDGRSCIAWIYRCMELCKEHSKGCIILPYDIKLEWTVRNIKIVERFLIEHGFVISDMVSDMHSYYLQDNPELVSAYIIVERVENVKSKYENQILPEEMIKNFYGRARKLPEYIRDDGSMYGLRVYDWKYGEKMY